MTWLRAAIGCLLFLLASGARAQGMDVPSGSRPDPPPKVAPPVAEGSTQVPYPQGASGDASVLLELLIEDDGSVSEVQLLEGGEPFATRALEAARTWKFRPALRDGVPVAVRIRARVDFRAPFVAPSPPTKEVQGSESAPRAAVPAQPVAEEEAVEVTVRGRRHEVGRTTISRMEIREMPGAFGDGFRAIEGLPGVTPTQSGVPYFFVRGAPPNNVGYYLDGVRLPTLFHLGLGGGVIHPGLVERIDFYPGAAPARFGGVAGAVVSAQTRLPALLPRGEISLRLIDAGALLEAPLANSRGSALVAGRYGYPGPVVSALSDTRVGYWDYQSRFTWQLASGHDVGLLLFGSHDDLGHLDGSGDVVEDLSIEAHRADARYDYTWQSGQLRAGATLGYDAQGANPVYLTNRSLALRFEFEQRASSVLTARAGLALQLDHYGVRREEPEEPDVPQVPSSVDPAPTNAALATYTDVIWKLTRRVEIVPGVRVAALRSSRGAGRSRLDVTVPVIEPRLGVRARLARQIAWVSALGASHQLPVLRVGELPVVVAGGSGFSRGNPRPQRTLHQSHGLELELPLDFSASVTGFLSTYSGLTDLTASCVQIEPPSKPVGEPLPESGPYFCPSDEPVGGHAYGAELQVRRPLSKRIGGWLSYTISRSVRDARFLTLGGTTRLDTVPSEFDRTHVLSGVLTYDLGRRWRAGMRLVAYSGAPYSRLAGTVPAPPYNSLRDPWFLRGDLRLEKRWRLGDRGYWAFVFEVQNATLSREANLLGMDCEGTVDSSEYTTRCDRRLIGPLVLPSVGLEAAF